MGAAVSGGVGPAGQRRWAPVYLRGLIAPGERKSVEPMARRQCPGDKEQPHHFVATSTWVTSDHERVLLDKAEALAGGRGAHLIVDNTALVKKGTHSVVDTGRPAQATAASATPAGAR